MQTNEKLYYTLLIYYPKPKGSYIQSEAGTDTLYHMEHRHVSDLRVGTISLAVRWSLEKQKLLRHGQQGSKQGNMDSVTYLWENIQNYTDAQKRSGQGCSSVVQHLSGTRGLTLSP